MSQQQKKAKAQVERVRRPRRNAHRVTATEVEQRLRHDFGVVRSPAPATNWQADLIAARDREVARLKHEEEARWLAAVDARLRREQDHAAAVLEDRDRDWDRALRVNARIDYHSVWAEALQLEIERHLERARQIRQAYEEQRRREAYEAAIDPWWLRVAAIMNTMANRFEACEAKWGSRFRPEEPLNDNGFVAVEYVMRRDGALAYKYRVH